MSDLTKASEALLASAVYIVNELDWKCVPLDGLAEKLLAIEAAVRSDTLADVAARLPEALCAVLHGETGHPPSQVDRHAHLTAAILAHLTGGPR